MCDPRSPICPSHESLLQCDPMSIMVLSESCITDETIVNAQEFSLLAFLFELIRDEVLVIPLFLPVAVTVGLTFSDVVVGNRKEVKN